MADLTHDQHDDAFHEIHLSGKQLVFLFMATTVISVVIFLCGVAVGRSVQGGGFGAGTGVLAAGTESEPSADLSAPEPVAESEPALPAESSTGYTARLTEEPGSRTTSPRRELRAESPAPPAERPAPTPGPEPEPEPEPQAPAPKPETTRPAASDAVGRASPGLWAVQVISLQNRDAAERIVRRLRTKDYPAYLVEPAPGAPGQLYKVQVGRYPDRAEAQTVESRLKKEEQFETWIVR